MENDAVRRTALLVRCTAEEAELIRQAAKAERRTISGYILNGILQRIAVRNLGSVGPAASFIELS